MSRYVIREIQHVIAEREVEADDEEAALELFYSGQGKECGHDGDVTESTLLSVMVAPCTQTEKSTAPTGNLIRAAYGEQPMEPKP